MYCQTLFLSKDTQKALSEWLLFVTQFMSRRKEMKFAQKWISVSSVLCDHLEGWDREGGREGGRHKGEEIWGYMYTYS